MKATRATAEGTSRCGARYGGIAHRPLGRRGLTVSAAGFGCYRVDGEHPEHEQALVMALERGVNLIDTSANYTDGASERLVGAVLERQFVGGRLARDEVVVVTKGGYIQGENYMMSRARRERGAPWPELVEHSQGLEHCIHPEFLEDQIGRSLGRLGLECIDFYLLHNPEYFLAHALSAGAEPAEARRQYLERIGRAMAHLQAEVGRGRIAAFGISSNTFGLGHDDPERTPLEDILRLAHELGPDNGLWVVEMPLNLLEPRALLGGAIGMAHDAGLGVLINRPLNAQYQGRLVRLAQFASQDAPSPRGIIDGLESLASLEEKGRTLALAAEMDGAAKHAVFNAMPAAAGLSRHWDSLGGLESWRTTRDNFLAPRMAFVLDTLDKYAPGGELAVWAAQWRQTALGLWEALDGLYQAMAAKQAAEVWSAVRRAAPGWAEAGWLSRAALRAVRLAPGVSCALVGMRRPEYVADGLAELSSGAEAGDQGAQWRSMAAESLNL